jgi:hypothetical protein
MAGKIFVNYRRDDVRVDPPHTAERLPHHRVETGIGQLSLWWR